MNPTFGVRLHQLREAQGVTRRDLGARTHLAAGYLEKIERGYNAPPSALAIMDIAKALRVDADELFALSGKIPPDLEGALKSRPLLLQLIRVAQGWNQNDLRNFLFSQGVPAEKISACDINRQVQVNDERLCRREPVTAELKRAVFQKDGYECVYCSSTNLLEIDHIQPVSVGGTNDIENLVASCSRCNQRKGNGTAFVRVFGRFRAEVEG